MSSYSELKPYFRAEWAQENTTLALAYYELDNSEARPYFVCPKQQKVQFYLAASHAQFHHQSLAYPRLLKAG